MCVYEYEIKKGAIFGFINSLSSTFSLFVMC
jgi:hypothetical protein